MSLDLGHHLAAVAIMKIRNPTSESLVNIPDHILQWHAGQLSAGHAGKTAFDRSQGFPAGLHVGIVATGPPAPGYANLKTKKSKNPRPKDVALI